MTPRADLATWSGRRLWLAGGAGALLLTLGVWLVVANLPRLLTGPESTTPAGPEIIEVPGEARRINATLFYVAGNGRQLEPVSREVLYSASTAGQATLILEAQLQPPPDGQVAAVPTGTQLRAVYLTPRGDAFVDLSRDVVTGHPGGSLNEALTVFAIVNALAVNLPEITAVQILVDGREVDSLNGHLDLRHPLGRSLRWIQRGP